MTVPAKPRAKPESFMARPEEIGERLRKLQLEEGRKPIDILAPKEQHSEPEWR